MEKSIAQHIIEDAGYKTRTYSGRSMCGKYCLGVDIKDKDVFTFISGVLESAMEYQTALDLRVKDDYTAFEELAEAFRNTYTDSLGRGQIVYFPGIEFVGDEDENEDENEDECQPDQDG